LLKQGLLVAVIILVGLVGTVSIGISRASPADEGQLAPSVAIAAPVVPFSKATDVVIMGSHFAPGQELGIVIDDTYGGVADIGAYLDTAPVANDRGAFAVTWNCS